jgi:hypothetical protein
MNEQEALSKMIAPAGNRPSKPYLGGVIQILVTSSCDKACTGCTQASQLARPKWFMTPEQYKIAVKSLSGYFGVVGLFGGNPALSPYFKEYCEILWESWVPMKQRGIWCNNPITVENAQKMSQTFNPAYSNLNVHLDVEAYRRFKEGWPQCNPVGLDQDSRHSPPWVAMRDVLGKGCPDCTERRCVCGHLKVEHRKVLNLYGEVLKCSVENCACGPSCIHEGYVDKCETCKGTGKVYDEEKAWELISGCDINQHWSAGIGVFRGQLRAWFCEVAMAQSILHQDDPNYPDTGLDLSQEWYFDGSYYHDAPPGNPTLKWWQLPMDGFSSQVKKHCHECGVPLRRKGDLAIGGEKDEVSQTHADLFKPKKKDRKVELITVNSPSGPTVERTTRYLQNA